MLNEIVPLQEYRFLFRRKSVTVRSTSDPLFKKSNSKIELNIGVYSSFVSRAGRRIFEATHKNPTDLWRTKFGWSLQGGMSKPVFCGEPARRPTEGIVLRKNFYLNKEYNYFSFILILQPISQTQI